MRHQMLAELRYYPEDNCYRVEFIGSRKLLKPSTCSVFWVPPEYINLTKDGESLLDVLDPDLTYAAKVTAVKKMKTSVIKKMHVEIIKVYKKITW